MNTLSDYPDRHLVIIVTKVSNFLKLPVFVVISSIYLTEYVSPQNSNAVRSSI